MASIYKKTYTKRDPATGQRTKRKTRKWWVKYRDANGTVKRVPGRTDKAATLQLAAKLEREAELKRSGVHDPYDEHWKRTLHEHLDAYERFLRAKGNSEKHVQQITSRAKKVIKDCGFVFWSDVSPSQVQDFLARLKVNGRSLQTLNFYLQAVKQFLNWMARDRRAPDNPLRVLSPFNVRRDRRHDRRALEEEELTRLVQAAEEGGLIEGGKRPSPGGVVRVLRAHGIAT